MAVVDKCCDTVKHSMQMEPVNGDSIQIWEEGGSFTEGFLEEVKGSAKPKDEARELGELTHGPQAEWWELGPKTLT